MSEINPKKPVVRGRASIVHSSLEVTVLWKSQLEKAIAWLIEREFEFSWEVKVGDSITPNTYTLTVHDIPWADNLKQFAKVLEKCDFQSDI